jgi:cell division protein FtsB
MLNIVKILLDEKNADLLTDHWRVLILLALTLLAAALPIGIKIGSRGPKKANAQLKQLKPENNELQKRVDELRAKLEKYEDIHGHEVFEESPRMTQAIAERIHKGHTKK